MKPLKTQGKKYTLVNTKRNGIELSKKNKRNQNTKKISARKNKSSRDANSSSVLRKVGGMHMLAKMVLGKSKQTCKSTILESARDKTTIVEKVNKFLHDGGEKKLNVYRISKRDPSGIELHDDCTITNHKVEEPAESIAWGLHEYLLVGKDVVLGYNNVSRTNYKTRQFLTMGLGQAYYKGFFNNYNTMKAYRDGYKDSIGSWDSLEFKKNLLDGVCIDFDDNQLKQLAYKKGCKSGLPTPCSVLNDTVVSSFESMTNTQEDAYKNELYDEDTIYESSITPQAKIIKLLIEQFPKIIHYHNGKFNVMTCFIPVRYSWFASLNTEIQQIKAWDKHTKYSANPPGLSSAKLLLRYKNHINTENLKKKIESFVQKFINGNEKNTTLIYNNFIDSFRLNCVLFNKMFSEFPIFLYFILGCIQKELSNIKLFIYHPELNLHKDNIFFKMEEVDTVENIKKRKTLETKKTTLFNLDDIFSSSCMKNDVGEYTFEIDSLRITNLVGDLSSIVKHEFFERDHFTQKLTAISLPDCFMITGELGNLAKITSLTSLNLSGSSKIKGELNDLVTLINLTSLNLLGCLKIEGNLNDLATLTKLTFIKLP